MSTVQVGSTLADALERLHAVDARQAMIEHHDVPAGAIAEPGQHLLAGAGLLEVIVPAFEREAHHGAGIWLVVDDENAVRHGIPRTGRQGR